MSENSLSYITLHTDNPIETLRAVYAHMPAAGVAELFLSPHVESRFLNLATQDDGPSLWIVNRSDVYDSTLEALCQHPIEAIAGRAKEKLMLRRGSLSLLSPPLLEGPLEEIPEFMIEDVLGHPLAPFEAMIYFSRHILEDYRASAALSLTRRLLEHPPNWALDIGLKTQVVDQFARSLFHDSSAYVRAYVARIPLLPESLIAEALKTEKHPTVIARLLQNPSSPTQTLESVQLPHRDDAPEQIFLSRVAAHDQRFPMASRRALIKQLEDPAIDPATAAAHLWYLQNLNS